MKHLVSSTKGHGWNVLIPVKRLTQAKSRLVLPDPALSVALTTAEVAQAFALDVITSALNCNLVERVFVVTNDAQFSRVASSLGCEIILERPDTIAGSPNPVSTLNRAIAQAALGIAARHSLERRASQPNLVQPASGAAQSDDESASAAIGKNQDPAATDLRYCDIAVIAADLPCLDTNTLNSIFCNIAQLSASSDYDSLGTANGDASAGRYFVRDHTGQGTTMLFSTALPGTSLDPRFGANSAQTHLASGALDISDSASLPARLDVDQYQDLVAAESLGLGPYTRRVFESNNL